MSLKDSIDVSPQRTSEYLDAVEAVQKGKKGAAERLSKYVAEGIITSEAYEKLIEKYHNVSETKSKSLLLKGARNVLSILLGLITYFIAETLLTIVFLFLLKIPVLSFLMTGYIPVDIFLSASVASGATFATVYIVRLISDYKSINYSTIIVFSMLLIIYIGVLIYSISTFGFDFTKLDSTLIFIGSLIFGCFMAMEN